MRCAPQRVVAIFFLTVGRIAYAGTCTDPSTGHILEWGPGESPPAACRTGGGGGGGSTYRTYSAPAVDWEAIRRQQEEAARAAEAERKRKEAEKAERERQEAEIRERQAEFERQKQDAVDHLKGIGKGGGETLKLNPDHTFGLKGLDKPEDTHLKPIGPRSSRSGNPTTVWQQLHCAFELTAFAADAARKYGPGSEDFMVDVAQALKALDGEPLEVECSKAPPMPKARSSVPPEQAKEQVKELLTKALGKAEHYKAGKEKLTEMQDEKTRKEEARKAERPNYPPKDEATAEKDPIKKAKAEQDAYHKKEREENLKIFEIQKKNEEEQDEVLELLRQAQAALNAANAAKVTGGNK